jgi:hypothetical protein
MGVCVRQLGQHHRSFTHPFHSHTSRVVTSSLSSGSPPNNLDQSLNHIKKRVLFIVYYESIKRGLRNGLEKFLLLVYRQTVRRVL